jgi:thiamine biosynthesis lipoprotein
MTAAMDDGYHERTTNTPTRFVEHVMGMPISLALRGRHTLDPTAHRAWREVVAQLREVDRVFSTYRFDSPISRLRRGELAAVDCSPEVEEVLELGRLAEHQSGGAFSIQLPGPDGVRRLDPSGVVKGWATERASEVLRDLDDTDFCLSAGGDVTCRSVDPDGRPWQIGVEDPFDPRRVLAVLPLHTGAVATSGTTHRGRHLVDARTGVAPEGIASVTVVTGSLTWADIDATAAFAHGRDAAVWLRGRPGRTALVVWVDGTTTTVQTPPAR